MVLVNFTELLLYTSISALNMVMTSSFVVLGLSCDNVLQDLEECLVVFSMLKANTVLVLLFSICPI